MMGLPQGWVTVKLANLLSIQSGFAFKSTDYQETGHFLIRIGNVQDGCISLERPQFVELDKRTQQFELSTGDILTSLTGNIGRVARIKDEHLPAALNQRVARLVPDKTLGFDGYLYTFLSSPFFRRKLAAHGQGGAQQNVSPGIIGDLEIPLPPLPEQRLIVRKLDTLSARSTTARTHLTAIENLVERMKGAVLSQALNGRLVASQFGCGEPTELGEFITGIEQGWSPKCDNEPELDPTKWAVLTTTAVQAIDFDCTENKRLPENLSPRPHLEVEVGDVLMTRAGPRVRCAVCCYVAETAPRRIFSDKVYRIHLDQSVEPEFFVMVMNAPETVRALEVIKSGGSESGLNLTQDRVKSLEISLWERPTQVEVVAEIKRQFVKIDRLAAEGAKAQKLLRHLDQQILAKAFAGDLVPQDPTDEPAEALLERIREARAGAGKSARGRRKATA